MFTFWILLELRMMEVVATTGAMRHTRREEEEEFILQTCIQN